MHEKRSLELEQLLGLPERWSSRGLQRGDEEKGVGGRARGGENFGGDGAWQKGVWYISDAIS
jgi:hypothetical protein